MSDLTKSLESLSPKKRALLEVLRKEQRADRCKQSILPRPNTETLPLSFAQQRLWFLAESQPDSATYNVAAAFRLQGSLDVDALKRVFSEIGRRHEVLRTIFAVKNGEPVQVIDSAQQMVLQVVDLENLPEDARESEALRLASQDAITSFDLSKGPLIRAALFKLSAEQHVLHLTLHHIVCDAWSMGVLFGEMAELYGAFSLHQSSPLPELPIQYADYAAWQREELSGEVLQGQLAYWKEKLRNPPALLNLPTDRVRPAIQNFRGEKQTCVLPASFASRLKTFAERHSVTPFVLMLAAFQSLLYRESIQRDIIVGSPVSGRTRTELEPLIGFFANMLPLRMNFSDDPTALEVLRRTREITLEAQENKDVPFETLVAELGLARDPSYSPLFQAGFSFVADMPAPSLPGIACTRLSVDTKISKWDITLEVLEEKDTFCCMFEYNTDLFNDSTVSRISSHFEVLLEAILVSPERKISQLPLLTAGERREILAEWNNTRSTYKKDRCVAQLFEAQAEEHPERLAVASSLAQLTYGELNQKANQLAHYLRERGVGPEVLVGICMERSVEMVVGLLAIFKAGGAYVPLDPTYAAERLAFMLEDAGAPVLLTQQSLLHVLPETTAEVICLDNEGGQIVGQSKDNLPPSVEARKLAYVIYTSGSTGRPKGVAIEHGGLLNLIRWHQRTYEVSEKDRATQLAAQAFDASVWELWPYLTAGASIHIPDEETRSSPSALMEWFAEERITLTFLATPLAEAALAVKLPRNLCLRALLTGGDRLHRAPQRELPFRLMNHYGPTENTVVATYCEVQPYEEGIPPIGRAISNTQVYVLDEGMQPVPVGVAGELYIGGESLARGYHRRPELTAEKFVSNPFSREAGARLYKTGDLVRYRADGVIEFLGRADDQVKIRGFRIELGEIAAALEQHDLVRQAIVAVREEATRDKQLVAYVVPAAASVPTVSELRHYLKAKLPDYMVPKAFVVMDKLPLTANGKVDHHALPEPERSPTDTEKNFVAPRNEVQRQIAEIWQDVLQVDRVGVEDNFFDLGGDSILTIQIISRAAQLGLRFTSKQLFQFQTIAELAKVVNIESTARMDSPDTGCAPLTPIQHWFFEQPFVDRNCFYQAMLFEISQPLEKELVERSLAAIVAHHGALRLRFTPSESQWRQNVVADERAELVRAYDLSALPQEQQTAAMVRVAEEVGRSFRLDEGPLVRAALFELGEARLQRLFVAIHHLAVDGVSWRILQEDLASACEQATTGGQMAFPPRTTSWKSWSEQLTQFAAGEALRREIAYWRQQVSGEVVPLPWKHHGENTVSALQSVHVELSVEDTGRLLHELPKRHRTQVQEGLLAALIFAFSSRMKGDLLLAIEGHGREDVLEGVDLSRTVGWFTSMYPVRLPVRRMEIAGQLGKAKEVLRAVHRNGIGYGLLRYLSPEREAQEALAVCEPRVSFNYLGQFQPNGRSALLRPIADGAGPLRGGMDPLARRQHDLSIESNIANGALRCTFQYSSDQFSDEDIEQLAQDFVAGLRELLTLSDSSALTAVDFMAARMSADDFKNLLPKLGRSVSGSAR